MWSNYFLFSRLVGTTSTQFGFYNRKNFYVNFALERKRNGILKNENNQLVIQIWLWFTAMCNYFLLIFFNKVQLIQTIWEFMHPNQRTPLKEMFYLLAGKPSNQFLNPGYSQGDWIFIHRAQTMDTPQFYQQAEKLNGLFLYPGPSVLTILIWKNNA